LEPVPASPYINFSQIYGKATIFPESFIYVQELWIKQAVQII
jgi:hypothetical protein